MQLIGGHNRTVWLSYFLGFVLTLLFKWGKYVRAGKKQGRNVQALTWEWFFEPSLSNISSWTTTVGGIWVLGAIYIERIIAIPWLDSIPVHPAIGFFLGTIYETTIPILVEKVASKIKP